MPCAESEKVAALGGTAKPAFDVGEQGRMAVCFDPNGAPSSTEKECVKSHWGTYFTVDDADEAKMVDTPTPPRSPLPPWTKPTRSSCSCSRSKAAHSSACFRRVTYRRNGRGNRRTASRTHCFCAAGSGALATQ